MDSDGALTGKWVPRSSEMRIAGKIVVVLGWLLLIAALSNAVGEIIGTWIRRGFFEINVDLIIIAIQIAPGILLIFLGKKLDSSI